jgi:hypothetical protein
VKKITICLLIILLVCISITVSLQKRTSANNVNAYAALQDVVDRTLTAAHWRFQTEYVSEWIVGPHNAMRQSLHSEWLQNDPQDLLGVNLCLFDSEAAAKKGTFSQLNSLQAISSPGSFSGNSIGDATWSSKLGNGASIFFVSGNVGVQIWGLKIANRTSVLESLALAMAPALKREGAKVAHLAGQKVEITSRHVPQQKSR